MTTPEFPKKVNPENPGLTTERIEAIAADETAETEKRELAQRLLTAEAFLKVVSGGGNGTSHHFIGTDGRRTVMMPATFGLRPSNAVSPKKSPLAQRLPNSGDSGRQDVSAGKTMTGGMKKDDSDDGKPRPSAASRFLDGCLYTVAKIGLWFSLLVGLAFVFYGFCLIMLPSITDWWLHDNDISRESVVLSPKFNICMGLVALFFSVLTFCESRTKRKAQVQSGRD
ncbi:hypothetical protein HYK36_004243 [Salmonella enterica]|nr:hypothetical protein [Salmonella enterica]